MIRPQEFGDGSPASTWVVQTSSAPLPLHLFPSLPHHSKLSLPSKSASEKETSGDLSLSHFTCQLGVSSSPYTQQLFGMSLRGKSFYLKALSSSGHAHEKFLHALWSSMPAVDYSAVSPQHTSIHTHPHEEAAHIVPGSVPRGIYLSQKICLSSKLGAYTQMPPETCLPGTTTGPAFFLLH